MNKQFHDDPSLQDQNRELAQKSDQFEQELDFYNKQNSGGGAAAATDGRRSRTGTVERIVKQGEAKIQNPEEEGMQGVSSHILLLNVNQQFDICVPSTSTAGKVKAHPQYDFYIEMKKKINNSIVNPKNKFNFTKYEKFIKEIWSMPQQRCRVCGAHAPNIDEHHKSFHGGSDKSISTISQTDLNRLLTEHLIFPTIDIALNSKQPSD